MMLRAIENLLDQWDAEQEREERADLAEAAAIERLNEWRRALEAKRLEQGIDLTSGDRINIQYYEAALKRGDYDSLPCWLP